MEYGGAHTKYKSMRHAHNPSTLFYSLKKKFSSIALLFSRKSYIIRLIH